MKCKTRILAFYPFLYDKNHILFNATKTSNNTKTRVELLTMNGESRISIEYWSHRYHLETCNFVKELLEPIRQYR